MLFAHKDILLRLEKAEQILMGHDKNISLLFDYLKQLEKAKQDELEYKKRKRIGYKRSNEI